MIQNNNWDIFFMKMVYLIADKSKDPSSKIGALIINDNNQIVKIGYNGFPVNVNDSILTRYQRPEKYQYTAHAEANAIFFAARDGVKTENCKIYTNMLCCIECAKAVIQSGIKKVVYHKQYYDIWMNDNRAQWNGHDAITRTLFQESGVQIQELDCVCNTSCIMNGRVIQI
jgi:dCMP deaminase